MNDRGSQLLADLPVADAASASAVRERASKVLRPGGALQRFDEIATWLAGWQRTTEPRVDKPTVIVFAADHGVAAEGVSAYPAEVTEAMLRALSAGVATATAMSKLLGVQLVAVDAGVGRPTGNLMREPAMSRTRFDECLETGRRAVASVDADLLIVGEMGIANTTAAAAICAILFGGGSEQWTGRGTGIDDPTLAKKVAVVDAARERVTAFGEIGPLEVLRQVGGSELVAIAGATVEARRRSIPMVLDGYVVTAAVASLAETVPDALDHCLAGHCSGEPGHRLLLEKLNKVPLLDLGMRLGEGSGALAALPLVQLAAACVTDVATFEEWGLHR